MVRKASRNRGMLLNARGEKVNVLGFMRTLGPNYLDGQVKSCRAAVSNFLGRKFHRNSCLQYRRMLGWITVRHPRDKGGSTFTSVAIPGSADGQVDSDTDTETDAVATAVATEAATEVATEADSDADALAADAAASAVAAVSTAVATAVSTAVPTSRNRPCALVASSTLVEPLLVGRPAPLASGAAPSASGAATSASGAATSASGSATSASGAAPSASGAAPSASGAATSTAVSGVGESPALSMLAALAAAPHPVPVHGLGALSGPDPSAAERSAKAEADWRTARAEYEGRYAAHVGVTYDNFAALTPVLLDRLVDQVASVSFDCAGALCRLYRAIHGAPSVSPPASTRKRRRCSKPTASRARHVGCSTAAPMGAQSSSAPAPGLPCHFTSAPPAPSPAPPAPSPAPPAPSPTRSAPSPALPALPAPSPNRATATVTAASAATYAAASAALATSGATAAAADLESAAECALATRGALATNQSSPLAPCNANGDPPAPKRARTSLR